MTDAPLYRRLLTGALGLLLLLPLLPHLAQAQEAGGGVHSIDHIIALVNDDVILRSELDRELAETASRLRREGQQLPPREALERQLLERLILTRVQLQKAEQVGVRVDDVTLNDALRRIAAQNNLSLGQFREVLEREGIDFGDFREKIREEFILTQLRQREVTNRVTVSDREVDGLLERMGTQADDGTQYHLAHILIAVPGGASPEQVQKARARAEELIGQARSGAEFSGLAIHHSDAQDALEGGDLGWRSRAQIPTLFVEEVVRLTPGEVAGPIRSGSGYHLVKLLESRGGERHIITQTHVRHILIKPDEIHSEEDVKLRLEQLRLRIEGGDDFAALARAHSQDRLSAAKGGDLDWVSPGELVPRFEEAMDALAVGQLSKPVESRFGWHLIQVLERRSHDSTQEFRRGKAKEILAKRKNEEQLELWLRRLRDEAFVEIRLGQDYSEL